MQHTNISPDYNPEAIILIESGWTVSVAKVGGGTVGTTYTGWWDWAISDANGAIIDTSICNRDAQLYTGTPKNHSEAAELVAELYEEGSQ